MSSLDTDSLQFGQLGIRCEPGRYPRLTTISCASCPLGSTYDSTVKKCVLCPKGMFRDDEDHVTCSSCPLGMSTPSNGTVNSTECRPICKKGYYSLDGIEPCTPCSRLEYGPSTLATKCEKCERGMMTNSSASTQALDCLAFDVAIRGGAHSTTVGSISSDLVSFTLASWVKLSKFDDISLQLSVKKEAQEIFVDVGQSVNITLHSSLRSSGVTIKRGVWQHIVVVWDAVSTTLKLFVQGTEQFTSQLTSVTAGITTIPSGSDLSLSFKGPSSTAGHISGLLLKTTVLSGNAIKTLAATCYTSQTGALYMDHFLQTYVEGLDLVTPSTCDAKDDCILDPCNGHKCIDGLNTFTCQCSDGYTGNTCQIPPDYCKNHKCEHGATCHNLLTNYTCSCLTGFKGQFCESKIVDGGYGQWGDWSICSKSCEGGQMVRNRVCDSPAPDPDGKPCTGQANETEACNVKPCPVCPHPPRSYGSHMSCNRSSDLLSCSVSCRDGMWFTPGFTPLEEYKCGKETAYQWNGKPPSCSNVYTPELLETSTTIQYNSVTPCHEPEKFKDALVKKSREKLQCSHNQTCEIDVTIEGCSGDRSKRSLSGVKAIITLRVPLVKGNNLDMENLVKTNAVSPAMMKLLQSVADLETSVRQLNSTRDILTFNVDGNVYNVLTIVSTGSVRCDKGKVRLEALCVDCPQGTFSSGRDSCLPCKYGTYQDLTGSEACKKCPKGVSTEFIGSVSEADCSVAVPIEDGVNSDEDDSGDSLGIIIGCTVAAVVLCGVVLGIGIRFHLRSKARKTKMGSFASMNMVHGEKPPTNTFLT
ncbi:signal peptide, CUB and EGF-like domain-containing protein 1 [Mizuhopecten yessoensis]|nr:signal peptide, CUB and EGF-like domain-containing protein 1 [Mizuhopecten yessoensis]